MSLAQEWSDTWVEFYRTKAELARINERLVELKKKLTSATGRTPIQPDPNAATSDE